MAYPHIIAAYEAVATASGEPLSVALAEIAEATGRYVDHPLWSKWRRGVQTPPPAALRYMAGVAVAAVLRAEGIDTLTLSEDALDRIAAGLTPPPRQP